MFLMTPKRAHAAFSPSIANDGTKFYFLTNKDAPQYKLVTIDIADPPEKQVFKDLIPEDEGAALEQALVVNNDSLVVVYKRNVCCDLLSPTSI